MPPLLSRFLCAFALLLLGQTSLLGCLPRANVSLSVSQVVTITPASQVAPASPFAAEVSLDAIHPQAYDEEALRNALKGAKCDIAPMAARLSGVPASETSPQDWSIWARFGIKSAPTRYRITSGGAKEEALNVYGGRSGEGVSLLLANRTDQPAKIRVRLTLPQGIYSFERLSFAPAPASAGSPVPTLQPLNGAEVPRRKDIRREISLEPHQITLLRVTDVSLTARLAFQQANSQLASLARSHGGVAQRIRAMLGAGEPYLWGVHPDSQSKGESKRLNCIYRLMLSASQAHALLKNLLAQNRLPTERGNPISDSLQDFEDAVHEVSGIYLGLLSYIRVTPEATASAETEIKHYTVALALANAGARSIEGVKIGIDRRKLPSEIVFEPADPASFGALAPGQTVRAVFSLKVPAKAAFSARDCVGDVSYYASGAPAHLYPKSW